LVRGVRRHREIGGVGDESPGASGMLTDSTAIATSAGIGTSPGIETNRNRWVPALV